MTVVGARCGIESVGHLDAVGTAAQPITFTAPGRGWSGLVFDGGTGRLEHTTVSAGLKPNSILDSSYAHSNLTLRNVLTGEVSLVSSVVSNTHDYGFGAVNYGLYALDSHLRLSDTLVTGLGHTYSGLGVYATGTGSVITITNSTFEQVGSWNPYTTCNNLPTGVCADNGSHVTIASSSFYSNAYGITTIATSPWLQSGQCIQNNWNAGILVQGGTVEIQNSILKHNSTEGLRQTGGAVSLVGTKFSIIQTASIRLEARLLPLEAVWQQHNQWLICYGSHAHHYGHVGSFQNNGYGLNVGGCNAKY
jgi:hypothetical protein